MVRANWDHIGSQGRSTVAQNGAGMACIRITTAAWLQTQFDYSWYNMVPIIKLKTFRYTNTVFIHVVFLSMIDGTTAQCFMLCVVAIENTHAGVIMDTCTHRHKAWYPGEVQSTSCCTVRGYIQSPSFHFEPNVTTPIDTIIHSGSPPWGILIVVWK